MIPLIETPIKPQRGWNDETYLHETSPDMRIQPNDNGSFLDSVIGGSTADLQVSGNKLVEVTSNQSLLNLAAGNPTRYLHTSRNQVHTVYTPHQTHDGKTINADAFDANTASLVVQSMCGAYAQHVPYSMRPDTFWYMIVHEVAEYVRQNPAECAGLFTDTPNSKQKIVVNGGDLNDFADPSYWAHALDRLRPALEAHARLGDGTLDLFVPRFSTSSQEDETALIVAFLDVVSPYYWMEWRILCGIPRIRLEGNTADWQLLYNRAAALASKFGGLRAYFDNLLPVLQKIVETAAGATPDEEFWRSIFQYDGGCGDPSIGGWITAFFAYKPSEYGRRLRTNFNRNDWRSHFKTDDFPSHISKFPFTLNVAGNMHSAALVAGVTGVDYDDTFLTPRLGYAVATV